MHAIHKNIEFNALEHDVQAALLEQLHELHLQLEAVRDKSQQTTGQLIGENNKIIVCSMSRCIRMEKSAEDDFWTYIPSRGGLKAAIDSISQSNAVQWVSWPGTVVDKASQDGIKRKLEVDIVRLLLMHI